MKNKAKIIIGSTAAVITAVSIMTPIIILTKKTNSKNEDAETPEKIKEQARRKLSPTILKSSLLSLSDDDMEKIDDKAKIISEYAHEVLKRDSQKNIYWIKLRKNF